MNDKINVMNDLQWIDDHTPYQTDEHAERWNRAIDAVAELVEAAKAPAVAFGCEGHTGVHFVSGERDECVEESRRDGSRVVELIVRPATALARMGEQA